MNSIVGMPALFARCAGLDVHLESIQACVRVIDPRQELHQEVRSFGTTTRALLAMAQWLESEAVTHVAMESTGVYWKPVYNILEGRFTVLLVNARHIRQVPGRKSDVKDCQWIAQLLQCGLLRGSFVPPRPQRDLRDLTRQRTQLVSEHGRVANRIQKLLEDTNIKLAAVVSDILGVSSRQMLWALVAGQTDPLVLAQMARGRMRQKLAQLALALEGKVTDHHRFMLASLLRQAEQIEVWIKEMEHRIDQATASQQLEIELLSEIHGIDRRAAQVLLAEIGPSMGPFPSAEHLAAWAGLSPGSDQSAGKRGNTHCCPANRWLRGALLQAAWAASHTRNTYLAAQYHRLAKRRGKKRALVAVAHSLLVIIYYVLKDHVHYRDLGADWFQQQEPQRLTRHLVARLQSLGYQVTLQPRATAA